MIFLKYLLYTSCHLCFLTAVSLSMSCTRSFLPVSRLWVSHRWNSEHGEGECEWKERAMLCQQLTAGWVSQEDARGVTTVPGKSEPFPWHLAVVKGKMDRWVLILQALLPAAPKMPSKNLLLTGSCGLLNTLLRHCWIPGCAVKMYVPTASCCCLPLSHAHTSKQRKQLTPLAKKGWPKCPRPHPRVLNKLGRRLVGPWSPL